ncbi:right-handed parallel beta-helix repeat-containing protein [bacterium]|nr:right-handed parallel beta-helix repeat-containing protein [bacterium]
MRVSKKFFKYRLVSSLTLISILYISTLAQAKTYCVAKNGNDSNSGTEAAPWATVDKAAATMVAGDTVYVKAGTYSGVGLQTSGTAGKYISYFAYPGDTVKVGQFYFYNGVSYIKVDGFDFVNGNLELSGGNNDYNIFSNNTIHSGSSTGINFGGDSEGNIIEGNIIYGVGHGVHTSGGTAGTIIRNNIIHDCYLHGLGMVGGTGEKYLNNIIYNCTKSGIHPGSGGPSNGEIRGNLVYNNGKSAIYVSASNFLIMNNSCVSKPGSDSETYYISGSGHVVKNNIGYRDDGVSYVLLISQSAITDYNDWYDPNNPKCISRWFNPMTLSEYQSYGQGTHSISKDPKFVNIAGNDFHLQPDSPCIDAGENGVDMGAYGVADLNIPLDGEKGEEVRNRPNPFRAGKEETLIEYDLEQLSNVTITIYDLLGQEVWRKSYREGENGGRKANSIPWDGRNLSGKVVANGGYICRIWIEKEHKYMVRKIGVAK